MTLLIKNLVSKMFILELDGQSRVSLTTQLVHTIIVCYSLSQIDKKTNLPKITLDTTKVRWIIL